MSEGPPQESGSPPPELEEGQMRHIPIQEPNGNGESVPTADGTVPADHTVGENYVEDPAKAEAMAYAGTDFRTKAVRNRAVGPVVPDKSEEEGSISWEQRRLDEQYRDTGPFQFARRRLISQQRDANHHRLNELQRDRLDAEDAREIEDRVTYNQLHGEDIPKLGMEIPGDIGFVNPGDRAAFYDEQATRIEDWAGALHDRPLSAEFKKAHPGVQFQPKALVRMENEAEVLAAKIEDAKEFPYAGTRENVATAIKGPDRRGTPPETSRLLARAGDKELDDEYERITGELYEKAKELDTLHNRLVDEVEIQPMRNRLAMTRNLLNDVRREVGRSVEEEVGEAETQDKPEPETEAKDDA